MLINDASITGSLIVNASASLQNISLGGNIIPDETNLRNLGSTDKYFKEIYVSTGSINFVDDGNIVAILNKETLDALQNNTASANSRLAAIENFTSSLNNTYTTDAELNASSSTLQLNIDTKLNTASFDLFTASVSATNTFTSSANVRLNALETTSASVDTLNTTQNSRLGSLETISASNLNRINSLEITSASVDTLNTTQNSRLNSLELKTGSLATTGSNTFYGQQVFSGSLYVQDNLIVQGSSSLQNITASAVSIGTNIVYLNTDTPSVRFAGLTVQDSGSSAGVTGSMLWDSLCNRWIYSNPSTIGYSGGMLISGPRTQTLGTESTLTCNYVAKSGGGDHLYDSCIWEMSGSVGINTNTPSYNIDVSGCGRINGGNFVLEKYHLSGNPILDFKQTNDLYTWTKSRIISKDGQDTNYYGGGLAFYTNAGGTPPNNITERIQIYDNGITCFSCQICAPYMSVGDGTQCNHADAPLTIKRGAGGFAGLDFKSLRTEGNIGGTRYYDCSGTVQSQLLVEVDGSYNFYNATSNNRLKITSTGIACFSCQICAPSMTLNTSADGYNMLCLVATGGDAGIYLKGGATNNGGWSIQSRNSCQFAIVDRTTGSNVDRFVLTSSLLKLCQGSSGASGYGITGGLQLESTSITGINILSPDAGYGRIYFSAPTGGTSTGAIEYIHCATSACAYMKLRANSLDTLFITGAGYAGIGTSCPAYPLDVASTSGDSFRIHKTGLGGSGLGSRMSFQITQTNNQSARLGVIGSEFVTGWGGDMIFYIKPSNGTPDDSVTERMRITSCGNIVPGANGTQNLGASSLRWSTVYTSDLSLSNGIGDYTIVEGENDLFLYNNKQCKVYKFMLEQVCAECATPKKS